MSKKLLLADGSATIQKIAAISLCHTDFEIASARTGSEAFRLAKEDLPDVIALDTVAPDSAGYDVCAQLRSASELAHVPVLLLTGASHPIDEARAAQCGASDWLQKPFDSQLLIEKIHILAGLPVPAPLPGVRAAGKPAPAPGPMAGVPAPLSAPATMAVHPHQAPAAAPPASRPPMAPMSPGARPPQPAMQRPPMPGAHGMTRPPPPAAMRGAPLPGMHPAMRGAPAPMPGQAGAGHHPQPYTSAYPLDPHAQEQMLRAVLQSVSREVIEKVVWEVVPQLAETIIREELERLIQSRGGT